MNRRDFLRKGLLAAGAASLAPIDGFSSLLATAAPSGADTGAAPQGPPANTATGTRAAATGDSTTGATAGGTAEPKYLKAMMWGMIGMQASSVLDKCRAVKAAGFDGIEPYSHLDRDEMLGAMRETGLRASGVCNAKHWEFPLSSPDAAVRRKGIDALYRAMDDAKFYGTDTVLLVPGIVNAEVGYDQCWNRTSEGLREVLPSAEKAGIRIGIENVWNGFLLSPLETAHYIDQFDSPAVGAYFDVGNIVINGWPEQWIDILGERIVRIHLKEFSRKLADTEGRGKGFNVPLGEGDVEWPRVMASLGRHYRGRWLTIEHRGGETPEGLADLSARWNRITGASEKQG